MVGWVGGRTKTKVILNSIQFKFKLKLELSLAMVNKDEIIIIKIIELI